MVWHLRFTTFHLIENSNVYCFIKSNRLSCNVGKCHDEMSDVNVIQARYDSSGVVSVRRTILILTLNLFSNIIYTRKHSSRMHTARFSDSGEGVSLQRPPGWRPPWTDTP